MKMAFSMRKTKEKGYYLIDKTIQQYEKAISFCVIGFGFSFM